MHKLVQTLEVLNTLENPVHFTVFDGILLLSRTVNSDEAYDAAQDALREADIKYVWRYNSIIVNPELL